MPRFPGITSRLDFVLICEPPSAESLKPPPGARTFPRMPLDESLSYAESCTWAPPRSALLTEDRPIGLRVLARAGGPLRAGNAIPRIGRRIKRRPIGVALDRTRRIPCRFNAGLRVVRNRAVARHICVV